MLSGLENEKDDVIRAPRSGDWLLWAIVAAIGAHIIEEYALNFPGWSARGFGMPISAEDFHLVNFGVIVYSIACAAIGWRAPWLSLSSASLVVLNAVGFHFAFSLVSGLYSPGTASALILFVPSGVAAYLAAHRAGVLTRRGLILSIAIGLAWHAFLGGIFYVRYFFPLYR